MSSKKKIIKSYFSFYLFSIYFSIISSYKLYKNLFKILKNFKSEKFSHISNKCWDLQYWYRRVFYIRKNFNKYDKYEKPFYEEESNKLNYFNTALGLYSNYNLFFLSTGFFLILLQMAIFSYKLNNFDVGIVLVIILLFNHSIIDQFKCQNYNLFYYIFFPISFFLLEQNLYFYCSFLISGIPGLVGISALFVSFIFNFIFLIFTKFDFYYFLGFVGYLLILPIFLKKIFNKQNIKFLFVFWLQNNKEKINYSRKRYNLASLLIFFSYFPFVICSFFLTENFFFILPVCILVLIQIFFLRLFDEQLIDLIYLISSSFIIISVEFNIVLFLSYLISIFKPSYDLFDHKNKKFNYLHDDIQYINTNKILNSFEKIIGGISKEKIIYFNYHPKNQYYSHFGKQKRWISLFQFLNAKKRIEIMPTWDHVFAMKHLSEKKKYDSLWASNFEEFIKASNYNKARFLLIQENGLNEKKIIKILKQKFDLIGIINIKKMKIKLNKEISKGNFYLFDKNKKK